jgi:hypothetical protein
VGGATRGVRTVILQPSLTLEAGKCGVASSISIPRTPLVIPSARFHTSRATHRWRPSAPCQVLSRLHEAVIPYLPTPVLLADFLTKSIDKGGLVGILALNGIFVLVQVTSSYRPGAELHPPPTRGSIGNNARAVAVLPRMRKQRKRC